MRKNPSARSRQAFTLIEVMVAAAITIIMVGMVIQITGEVLKLWNRSMGKLSANAEARMAMELLTGDLEAILLRNNDMLWLYADDEKLSSVAGYDAQTVSLAMFTSATDRMQEDSSEPRKTIPGNITAVEYQLVYQSPVSGRDEDPERNAFALHRRLIDPVTTFNSLLGQEYQEDFEDWLGKEEGVNAPGYDLGFATYEAPSDPKFYLAGNIVGFQVEFYLTDADGNTRVASSPVEYGGSNATGNSTATVGPFPNVIPEFKFPIEYADISLTVISDEGMAILRNLEAERGGTGFENTQEGVKQVILQHGEVFKRRVHFKAKPF